MSVAGLIESYGYLAVAAGTFLEGETVLSVAGFAAYRGHFALSKVILVATVASFLGDQLFFYLGRRYGTALLARFPATQLRVARARNMLHRHHLPLILLIRFLYGLRTPGLIAIGMSHVSPFKFFGLSLVSAVAWSIVIASAGYVFGQALENLLTDVGHYTPWIMGALLLGGSLWFLLSRRSRIPERRN